MGGVLDGAVAALIAAVPATVGLWVTFKIRKQTKPSNGHTLAQLVEMQTEWQHMHQLQDNHNFGVLADELHIPRSRFVGVEPAE